MSGANDSWSALDDLKCELDFEALKQDILSVTGITAAGGNFEFETYEDAARSTVYTFTRPPQYAHPAIIRRTVVKKDKAIKIATSACCYSTKQKCDRLIKEFQALDAQVRTDMETGSQR